MVHDKYGRQIEVGDEVIVRGTVTGFIYFDDETSVLLDTRTMTHEALPREVEKVASDPGPFPTNDMPVKGDKCTG